MTDAVLNNETDRKALASQIEHGVSIKTKIEFAKNEMKALVDALAEKYQIDKAILRRMIKTKYNESFTEESKVNETFEILYEGTFGQAEVEQ